MRADLGLGLGVVLVVHFVGDVVVWVEQVLLGLRIGHGLLVDVAGPRFFVRNGQQTLVDQALVHVLYDPIYNANVRLNSTSFSFIINGALK